MTREDEINILYGIRADNLNLNDDYTKDKYDALTAAIKALEQEPTPKNDLGVDAVSRQAVLELIADYDLSMGQVVRGIHALPPVIPQEQKTGHWINKYHSFESCSAECSSCHKRSDGYMHDNGFSLECKYYDFCPNCGAKMAETEEE